MIHVRCPITYEKISSGEKYSLKGIKKLSRQLKQLNDLPFSASELLHEVTRHVDKMSIQGVQPKLSAVINVKKQGFDIVDQHARYILKPPSNVYPELSANEDVSMRMAAYVGIETPFHGMIYNRDNTLTYFIRRFDRYSHNKKYAVEDFAQLAGMSRDTKYNFSMERIITIIEEYCTFPMLEKAKLFKRIIFNYLIGNEDMHLKNYSLIVRDEKISLAPAYDFLNSTIVVGHKAEDIALPINGRKNNLRRKDLVDYYAFERLQLTKQTVQAELDDIKEKRHELCAWVEKSFLSDGMQEKYLHVLDKRYQILFA